ncbi:hypothetical protein [Eisenibacter elegans]|jgi:hypothetical protein|uniref:hypothetical protein n=1 Tax=Eisenibacter elegans TaxID=997 RepID=UPI00040A8CAF|nr:hypothetical protein [Eisenibacter elegans]
MMHLQTAYRWLTLWLLLAGAWLALVGMAQYRQNHYQHQRMERAEIAKSLILSDMCLTTESRHTRHPNTPELVAPFQDFPGYHEHFPSSSFFSPRVVPSLRTKNEL